MNDNSTDDEVHFSSYRRYFNSGFYQRRYPKPNTRTLKTIEGKVNRGDTILDIGCGDGRYALQLFESCKLLNALDISEEAVKDLRQSIIDRNLINIKVFVCKPPIRLKTFFPEVSLDGIIIIFGVLSHIVDQQARSALLDEIHASLKSDGFLVLSVPNSSRRFLKEQKMQQNSTIFYTRLHEGSHLEFNYKLFQLDELRQEIHRAGFSHVEIIPESIFPETFVVNSKILGWLDKLLCAIVPTRWAYGYLVTAIK